MDQEKKQDFLKIINDNYTQCSDIQLAYKYFKEHRYAQALDLYEQLSNAMESKFFTANIKVCKKRLKMDNYSEYTYKNTYSQIPKISIIIPVYNTSNFLDKCLQSVTQQSLTDIEIICINDASEDGCLTILRNWQSNDHRIKIISYNTRKSASQARKDGVLLSSGKYIMFLDSDDYYEKNACENLYYLMEKNKVDSIIFNTNIIKACEQIDNSRINNLDKWLNSAPERIYTHDMLFDYCFKTHKLPFTLWNKIYKADVCKLAFSEIKDGYYPKANDLYAFFIILTKLDSILKINNIYYNYNFGVGVTGSSSISSSLFRTHCMQSKISEEIKNYNNSYLEDKYDEYANIIQNRLINECIHKWYNYVSSSNTSECYNILVKSWGISSILPLIIEKYFYQQGSVAKKIYPIRSKISKHNIKNIAIFYHRLSVGGVQRVIHNISNYFINNGYNIIIIIEEQQKIFYTFDSRIKIIQINKSTPYTRDDVIRHSLDMIDIIKNNKIDLFLYQAGSSGALLWDIMAIKAFDIPIIVSHHECFSYYMSTTTLYGCDRHDVFKLADRVTVLTRAAEKYFISLGISAQYIPNDISYIDNRISSCSNHTVICVGRLGNTEKQYNESFRIIAEVKKTISDVKCLCVGPIDNDKVKENIVLTIHNLGIDRNIIFCGSHEDVSEFYLRSSILLITSYAEGFPMVLAEAKSHGIPTVMYNLPYIELVRDSRGIISVEQYDVARAAEAIISVLNDKQIREQLSREALDSAKDALQYPVYEKWTQLIQNIDKNIINSCDEDTKIILESLIFYYRRTVDKYQKINNKYKLLNNKPELPPVR